MSVVLLEDVKKHLNLTSEANDVELRDFINAAESAISRRVGPLQAQTYTEQVSGRRTMLEVKHIPLVDVVSLTTSAGGPTMDLAGLIVDRAGVIERRSGYGGFAAAAYTVVYRAGWQTGDLEDDTKLPAEMVLAVKEMVRHLWATQRGGAARPGSRPSDAVANTVPGAAYALPIRVEQLIGPYVPLASA